MHGVLALKIRGTFIGILGAGVAAVVVAARLRDDEARLPKDHRVTTPLVSWLSHDGEKCTWRIADPLVATSAQTLASVFSQDCADVFVELSSSRKSAFVFDHRREISPETSA